MNSQIYIHSIIEMSELVFHLVASVITNSEDEQCLIYISELGRSK